MSNKEKFWWGCLTVCVLLGILSLFYIFPKYGVWQQSLSGEAELRRAEYSKRIAVEEAKAKLDSAKLYADAEVERAKGPTEANLPILEASRLPEGRK